jgi:NADPH-dependent ferric siderophore reductase
MPHMPKWMGNVVETVFKRFIHDVTVSDVTYIHSNLKKVTFTGDFSTIDFKLTQAVAFRVDDIHYRNYTPNFFDSEAGICSVCFYLHGNGPGSTFASRLRVGDKLKMIGPRGKSLYEAESKYHFFFGDETSLGLFNSLKTEIHANQQEYLGVLTLHPDLFDLPDKLDLMLDVVPKDAAMPYEHSAAYLNDLQGKLWDVWRVSTFYLTGNANAIKGVRKVLLTKGVPPRNIRAQAFWAEGRQGL